MVSLVKRRSARRAKNAGAIIFVVAMTLAVLGSLGLYALNSASSEIKASGHERQAAQTQYLAEYGAIGASQFVTQNNAALFLSQMRDTTGKNDRFCLSLADVPATAPQDALACRRLGRDDMALSWARPALNPSSLALVGTNAGSLGVSALEGDFYVELTDPALGPSPPNMQIAGAATPLCFVTFNATAIGLTRPNAYSNALAKLAGQGVEQTRARITAGPIPCPSGAQ